MPIFPALQPDLQAKTLFDGTLQAQQAVPLRFEAEGRPAGLYLLRAVGERFMQTQRVTVVR